MKEAKSNSKYHELMHELISEVTKESASRTKLKDLTKKVGIPYVTDSVEQMSIILKHFENSPRIKEGPQSL